MVNYRINEAETIFEPFYDSGESYPDHQKYSVFSEYTVTMAEGTVGKAFPAWESVGVKIESQTTDGYGLTMERDCKLDIREYDILRLTLTIPENMDLRIRCTIDGKTVTVLERAGVGDHIEMDAPISGLLLTHIWLEFRNRSKGTARATLYWMGLANSQKLAEMLARKSPYDENSWVGCFKEGKVDLKPMIGIYFDGEELPALRQRLNREPFRQLTDQLREKARKSMEVAPEPWIGEYLPSRDHRWVRDRDMNRPKFQEDMDTLAFIGILDENEEMLRMACRKLLAVAVTPKWSESIMGSLPGATWHHRSFTEDSTCSLCALVLDWAGNLLTWHGKNLVYDALMLKGLPRLEADFHSVDYIRWMNQGIVFNTGRILALLALAHRYPRYEARLQDAAKDQREMIDNYIYEDGGTTEGPAYWNYTFSHALIGVTLLARHAGQTLEEYAWDKLKKTGTFALGMLSDSKDGTYFLPVNDAHTKQYGPVIYSGFGRINRDPRWDKLYSRVMLDEENPVQATLETLLLSADVTETTEEIHSDGFQTFNDIGHTSLRRTTQDVGRVHCYLSGGPAIFAHSHSDRGQIVLEVDHIPMLIDRGICSYQLPYGGSMMVAGAHNLFCPEAPEGQLALNQNAFYGIGAKVVRSTYENGLLDYCTDTTAAWDKGIFTSITRSVRSQDAHIYLIYDDAVMEQPLASSFRLSTRGEISRIGPNSWAIVDGDYQITVTPLNYEVVDFSAGEDGLDENIQPVNALKLFLAEAGEQHIVTLLEVSRVGQQKAKILSEKEIEYNGRSIAV